jgi:formate hydrogenlyase subunit 6/NADH:ubiquinone oxidoreductase subunit I
MGAWSYIKGTFIATWAGFKHLFRPRMTLRYPEQKLDLQGPGYRYDAKQGVGLPGFKGRHLLRFEKCTGCQLCAIACDGVAVAIDMQKVQKGKPQNKKDIWPAVDYGRCVPPSTPIITLGGIKPMSEIRVGDEVLTHTGKFRKVTRLFGRTYAGKLYTFRTLGNFEPLTTTEDHPILTYGEGGVSWAFASEIKYRTYLTRPVISEEVPLSEIQFTYELYHPGGRGGTFTTELVALKSTPALMRLIGYYLAEGASDRYRVSFDIHKNEIDLKEDIIACVNEVFGANVSLKPDSDSQGLKIVVDSVRVASFFDQFGHHADLKNIPWWMTLLPKENIGEIVRAEFRGDGHYSDKYYKYKTAMHSNYFTTRTTSQTLALQVHFMLGRLGIVSSISTQKQKNRKLCYSVTVHSPYVEKMGDLVGVPAKNNEVSHSYVHLRDGMIMAPVIKIEVQEVKDFLVQNIEVEEDNSYVAANISVHNCVFCGLCVEPDTPVITNPGVKPLSDVTVGEMLLTHTGEYRPVTKIWDMMYTGPLYRIYAFGRPQPLVCTKDHRILAVSRPYGNRRDGRLARTFEPLLMTLPETLKAGDYLVSPIVKKTVKLNRYVADIPFGPRKKFKHLSLEATPDLFRLIGYYIAEGSCNSSAVSFSLHKKEKGIIEDISSLSRRYFGKSPSVAKATGDGVNVVLSSVVAVRFFSQFGRGAQNKKVSDWVFHSEKSKLLQLVKGIFGITPSKFGRVEIRKAQGHTA